MGQVERTKRDIIAAFQGLLQKQNFDDITVDAICKAALVNRTTFYRYFPSKVELALALISRIFADLAAADNTDLVGQFCDFFDDNRALIRHLLPETQGKFYGEFVRLVADYLNAAADPKHETTDPLVAAIRHSISPLIMSKFMANALIGLSKEALASSDMQNIDGAKAFLRDAVMKLAR